MGTIVISIPVHEASDVVADQVANVHRFVPGATVVLHVSREFRVGARRRPAVIEEQDGLLVNPQRLSTKSEGLLPIHLANFAYASTRVDIDWFVINASNDLYVRPGLVEHLGRYGAFARPVPLTPDSTWAHAKTARQHDYLQELSQQLRVPASASTPEGTAYSAAMFADFARELMVDRPYVPSRAAYPDEETVLPTMVSASGVRLGLPFVLSEVTAGRPLTVEMIDAVRSGTFNLTPKQFYGSGAARRAYDPAGLFAVKRIPRAIDHPLRAYVRGLA